MLFFTSENYDEDFGTALYIAIIISTSIATDLHLIYFTLDTEGIIPVVGCGLIDSFESELRGKFLSDLTLFLETSSKVEYLLFSPRTLPEDIELLSFQTSRPPLHHRLRYY